MSILLFLILASLVLALSALVGFAWAVKTGQFDDTSTPSMRVLMDDGGSPKSNLQHPEKNQISNPSRSK